MYNLADMGRGKPIGRGGPGKLFTRGAGEKREKNSNDRMSKREKTSRQSPQIKNGRLSRTKEIEASPHCAMRENLKVQALTSKKKKKLPEKEGRGGENHNRKTVHRMRLSQERRNTWRMFWWLKLPIVLC